MTIFELGAIGEFVGAALLFASLIFVGFQVRQNNLGMRVAAKQEMTRQYSDYMDTLIQNPEVSSIYVRGLAGEPLEDQELVRFNYLMSKAAWYYASMHYQREVQRLSYEEWHQQMKLIIRMIRRKGFRAWWLLRGDEFPADFRSFVDSHMLEDEMSV